MIVPDINLLLYAHIDGFPEHARARRWWETLLNGGDPIGVPLLSVFGFLRIATNPRSFSEPMTVEAAIETVERWLARDDVQLLHPGRRHLGIAFDLLRQLGTAANLTTDVQLAALAIEHQAELHSADVDFARFPGLQWINPLEARR